MYRIEKCIICKSDNVRTCFRKESSRGEFFTLIQCRKCGLEFLSEVPGPDDIEKYYENNYFKSRTDRGYNNYFSNDVRNEIERVFKLNLEDLKFFEFENKLPEEKRSLDIGCAAGYFVNYMKGRKWDSHGIDISKECTDFGKNFNLNIINGSYLDTEYDEKFNLISLWATIEHLHRPDMILKKIHKDLKKDGHLYISTCRIGGLNFKCLFGKKWRFYNFPEHIYFFSSKNLQNLLKQNGFRIINYVTYGSNFGKSGSKIRKMADFFAKRFYLGDMMLISAAKIN